MKSLKGNVDVEAEIWVMPLEDEGRSHKPRNVSGHWKFQRAR